MFIIDHRRIFFAISAVLVAFSVFSAVFWGLNPGIEFTGGAIAEVRYENGRPELALVKSAVTEIVGEGVLIQPTGESGYVIRVRALNAEEHQALLAALSVDGTQKVYEERYSLVGPSIGSELKNKAWISIVLVITGIVLFIAFAFRRSSYGGDDARGEGAPPWHYSIAAIVALVHDIAIPTGVFSFLGSQSVNAQIDVLFVTALLAILGYSVHDTIVVFDRVRENLKKNREMKLRKPFPEIVGEGLMQTMSRSINTSLTTLLALIALYFFGSEATKNFALVLSVGIVAGTYSSIFLAAPILVAMGGWRKN